MESIGSGIIYIPHRITPFPIENRVDTIVPTRQKSKAWRFLPYRYKGEWRLYLWLCHGQALKIIILVKAEDKHIDTILFSVIAHSIADIVPN